MKRIISITMSVLLLLSVFVTSAFSDDTSDVLWGDVNCDGKISLADPAALLRYLAGWDMAISAEAADVSGNGKLNLTDVSRILKYIAKWDIVLGPDDYGSSGEIILDDNGHVIADFGNENFRILHYGDTAVDYTDNYITAEDSDGSVISEAIKDRNKEVEERYNIKIVAEECNPIGEATIRMKAGQCDFELINEWGIRSKSAMLDGFLYDISEFEYINLDESYWYPSLNEDLSVAGKLYVTANAATMHVLDNSEILYFNKNLMYNLKYRYPYDYVKENNWTYDILIPMALGAEEDLNSDGDYDKNDQYAGLTGQELLMGVCNAPLILNNGDGTYTFNPYTDQMVENYKKYNAVIKSINELTMDMILEGEDTSRFPSQFVAARYLSFGEGHTLFMKGTLGMATEFVDMHSDYGIVPMPTVNPGDEFKSRIDAFVPMFSVPCQVDDPLITGIVLEYMAHRSDEILFPAYLEQTIHTKRMQDVRDYAMIDIVRGSMSCDWTQIYLWDGDIATLRNRLLIGSMTTSTGIIKRYAAKCQQEVDKFVGKVKLLD